MLSCKAKALEWQVFMEKMLLSALFDIYGGMLTKKQRETAEMYFSCDLTLSEIADQNGVSRQSVFDSLAKTEKTLCGYEENIGFYRERENKLSLVRSLYAFAETLPEDKRQQLISILEKGN